MRMYVLVDKEMPLPPYLKGEETFARRQSYNHVQGTHAVARFILENPNTSKRWDNQTLIVLGVSRRQLKFYCEKIIKEGLTFSEFHEPDIEWYATAIATVANDEQAKIFKRLELL